MSEDHNIIKVDFILTLQGSQAYARALLRVGILTEAEEEAIHEGLNQVIYLIYINYNHLAFRVFGSVP